MPYSAVAFDTAAWERATRDFPAKISPVIKDSIAQKGAFEFQFDSISYAIPITGQSVVLPSEVANHARRRGLIFENHLSGVPIELIKVEREVPFGIAADPFACSAVSCKKSFTSFEELREHMNSEHPAPVLEGVASRAGTRTNRANAA